MGKILAICTSPSKGTPKTRVGEARLITAHGIEGDAHAGAGKRQISLLSHEKIEDFRGRGANVGDGAFGENLVVEGVELRSLPVGSLLRCGKALLRITQIGKACHSGCSVFQQVGDCIMPREGVFAEVLEGGVIRTGDEIYVDN